MAHWAKIENGIVVDVTVGSNDEPDEGLSWLQANLEGEWVKTSYNTRGGIYYNQITGEPDADQSKAYRFNYAGKGYSYDPNFGPDGAFIPPKPYQSWTLNPQTAMWDAPVPMPNNGGPWRWDEETTTWVRIGE